MENTFFIFTGISAIMFTLGLWFAKERILQTYRDGKHGPEWFDVVTYLVIVAILVWQGQLFTASLWCYCMGIDLMQREMSKEK